MYVQNNTSTSAQNDFVLLYPHVTVSLERCGLNTSTKNNRLSFSA